MKLELLLFLIECWPFAPHPPHYYTMTPCALKRIGSSCSSPNYTVSLALYPTSYISPNQARLPYVLRFNPTPQTPDFLRLILDFSSLGAILFEQLSPPWFPLFFFFFQEKLEKQDVFPNFGSVTEGKISGTLRLIVMRIRFRASDFFGLVAKINLTGAKSQQASCAEMVVGSFVFLLVWFS